MNNLEHRLRDALDAAAGTVPDHATGPGLEADERRSHHPVRHSLVALGAAAAVIAAVAVPLAIRHVTRSAAPPSSAAPCPGPASALPADPLQNTPTTHDSWSDGLPAGPAPRVPFTVTDDSGAGVLQDGSLRLPLTPGRHVRVLDRLDCGWLVLSTAKQFGSGEVGVLLPDGRFTVRGNSDGLVGLSEDRSRIALTRDERIVVTDLDTGDEVASTPAPAGAVPFAWNQSGVWFGYESGDAIHLNVWQPGSQPRSVTWTGGDIFPVRDTDLLIAPEDVPCVQVLRLQPDGTLATVMKRCDPNQGQASLSPDGRILVTSSGKAYRVHDNTPLEYTVPDGLGSPAGHLSPAIWEDSTHLLLDSTMGMDDETGRRIIVRCDVISGSCERLYDANRASELVLGRP